VRYDVVVLTRGGGSASDLMYFDNLDLGTAISEFNRKHCPVLSAIGHERDFTIPDFVAWKRFDTPTAVARGISEQVTEYVSSLGEFADLLDEEINWLFQRAESETDPERLGIMSDRIRDNMNRTEHFFEDGIRVLSGTILHRIVQAVNDLGSFNPTRYVISIERAMNEISAAIEGVLSRAETTIQRSLQYSESQLDYAGLRNQLDRHLMYADGQVELLDKGILRLLDDTINGAGSDLDNLFNELTMHGGYAASLLFGGVVLKKAGKIVNSVRLVSPGDGLDCIFKDGEAKATIDEVKSEV